MAETPRTSIEERFQAYVEAFSRGEADPDPVLDGLDLEDRRKLSLKIEQFLESGPRPDPAMFSPGSPEVTAMRDRVLARLDGRAGGLSRLLVERRAELDLSQTELVSAIADEVDASAFETEKIDAYYHDLEWGTLPAAGLAGRLIELLADRLGLSETTIREAALTLGPGRGTGFGQVYARKNDGGDSGPGSDQRSNLPLDSGRSPEAGTGRRSVPPDRIDDLFTGG